jgi:hypothetical protein
VDYKEREGGKDELKQELHGFGNEGQEQFEEGQDHDDQGDEHQEDADPQNPVVPDPHPD